MTCYWLFHCLQATTSQNVLSHKFTLTELLQRSASVIIKRHSFFELQSEAKWLHIGATFITKWGNSYNFIKNAVERTNGRNSVNRFWQPTSSFKSNLFGDRQESLRS